MHSKSTYYVKMLVQNLIDLDTDTKDPTSAHFRDINSKLLIQDVNSMLIDWFLIFHELEWNTQSSEAGTTL